MKKIMSKTRRQAMGLGAVAGMRSMSAPAILSHYLAKSPEKQLEDSPLHYVQSPSLATGMKVLAVAELLADKLPQAPDRIGAPQLVVRVISGAIVGATLSEAHGEKKLLGAVLGGLGAVAASYAFFYLRKKLVEVTGIPDTTFALVEDALAISAGAALLKV